MVERDTALLVKEGLVAVLGDRRKESLREIEAIVLSVREE